MSMIYVAMLCNVEKIIQMQTPAFTFLSRCPAVAELVI